MISNVGASHDRMRAQTADFARPKKASPDQSLEPISVRIATAVIITGLSRSRIYELIQSGDIEVSKVGRSTLVLYRSLRQLIDPR